MCGCEVEDVHLANPSARRTAFKFLLPVDGAERVDSTWRVHSNILIESGPGGDDCSHLDMSRSELKNRSLCLAFV